MSLIMIVEDNDDVRELTSELLSDHGYRVLEARNGQHALELLDNTADKPGLLLLDLMMPVMGGVELLQILEASGRLKDYVVIVISAANCRSADVPYAARFVSKPADYSRLIELIKELCPANAGCA